VVRQGGRLKTSFCDFLKICTHASIIVALFYALYLGLVTSKQFDKGYFLSCNMLIGCFFWAAILGAHVIFGVIPT